jgi:hypothetical protein
MKNCFICGEKIDLSACNKTYTIITEVFDSDETGTRKTRKYLCSLCGSRVESFIASALVQNLNEQKQDAEEITREQNAIDRADHADIMRRFKRES